MEPLTPTGEKLMVPKVSFQGEQAEVRQDQIDPKSPARSMPGALGYSLSALPPTMVLFWGWADISWPLFGQPPASGKMNF